MSDDLISRTALLAAYDAAHKGPPGEARKLIEEAPAVDAEPVRNGCWISGYDARNGDYYILCSECGARFDSDIEMAYQPDSYPCEIIEGIRRCPRCGAKMSLRKPLLERIGCEMEADDD